MNTEDLQMDNEMNTEDFLGIGVYTCLYVQGLKAWYL